MSPSNTWCTATSLLGSFFPKVSIARARGIRSTLGTDSKHLLADHFPQAERRLADAEVDELGQRVELKFVQRGRRGFVHAAPASDLPHGAREKIPERRFGERFGKKGGANRVGSVDDLLLVICGNHRNGHRGAYPAKLRRDLQPVSVPAC